MREMMAAFEAFKGANDLRLGEIEKKAAADVLLEEKVARIDQAVASAQARLDRVMSQSRRPVIGGEPVEPASAPEAKAAWDGYLKTGQSAGLEVKAGLSGGATSGGYVVPYETERAIERRLMAASPMREIATVRTVATGVFRKPVSTAGVACGAGWRRRPRGRRRIGDPGPAGVPVGGSLRQSGGDPGPAGRRHGRSGRMAGGRGRGRLCGAGDPGVHQRRRGEQARGLLSYPAVADAGPDLGSDRLCRVGRGELALRRPVRRIA